ncbi:MAG: response regulator [Marmoricola sp.]
MRIVICDDHRLLLEALAHALALHGFTVESATCDPAEAVAAVKLYDPDLLLIDLTFPEGSGLEAAREVLRSPGHTRVVVITGSDDPAPLLEAVKIGVAGYIRKDQRMHGIVAALQRALAGSTSIDPSLAGSLRSMARTAVRRQTPLDRLTPRELLILGYLSEGLRTSDIVARMGISNSTVRSHIQGILSKLGVHSRLEAVALADQAAAAHTAASVEGR